MKKEKLVFLKPKEGNSMGQWLIEQGISAGFPFLLMILKKLGLA